LGTPVVDYIYEKFDLVKLNISRNNHIT